MKRRKALTLTATLMGSSIVGAEVFLNGCTPIDKPKDFTLTEYIPIMDEIGETILPESPESPGAKSAHIGNFMNTIVTDCYNMSEAEIFKNGLVKITNSAKTQFNQSFVDLPANDKYSLIAAFDKESHDSNDDGPDHFFTMMKQLAIWGYFTSEPGATKALRYNPIPGRYDACVDYSPGDKAWV